MAAPGTLRDDAGQYAGRRHKMDHWLPVGVIAVALGASRYAAAADAVAEAEVRPRKRHGLA